MATIPKIPDTSNEVSFTHNFSRSRDEESQIVIKTGDTYRVIKWDKIVYLKSDDNYTHVYLSNHKDYMIKRTMKSFREDLPEPDFYQCHKSYLVNMKHIDELKRNKKGWKVMLSYSFEAEVSRRKLAGFRCLMKSFYAVHPPKSTAN